MTWSRACGEQVLMKGASIHPTRRELQSELTVACSIPILILQLGFSKCEQIEGVVVVGVEGGCL